MRRFRILCIPPYEGMRDLIDNIAARRSDVELLVHKGNLEEGLMIAKEKMKGNIDAIISRGCTTEIIRENVSILTYDIAPSVYDILRIIRTAQDTGEKYAVVGYQSITQAAKMLRTIIQYDFRVCTIHSEEECLENLNLLKSEGFGLIVGDMMAVNLAREMDLHSLLVTSGIESINTAIDATIDILNNYDSMNQRIDLFTDMLNAAPDTIIVYDQFGELYYSSPQELPEDISEVLRENVSAVIARGRLNMIRRRSPVVYTIFGMRFHTKGTDFCAFRVRTDQKTDMFDRYSIQELSAGQDIPDTYPLEYYLGNDTYYVTMRELCLRYADMNQPVLILGDRGTGKERIGHYIYSHSRLKQSSLIILDAGLLDEKGWKYLLESDSSPLNTTGITIYFKRMELIPPIWRNRLMLYLRESDLFRTNRVIFAYLYLDSHAPEDDLYLYLNDNVNCLRVILPSLAERKQEIPSLISMYVNACNIEHGTQVMGFTPDAMLLLQNYHWTRNNHQLFQAVKDLVLNSEAAFISTDSVRRLLEKKESPADIVMQPQFDLNRTLEEIEREIVQTVFEQENMNQSKTAKRLGISRSTVWRLLK